MSEQDKKFYATSAFLMIDDLKKENDELKHRIEKATEYINNTTFFGLRNGKTFMSKYLNELLNILQNGGEDNE